MLYDPRALRGLDRLRARMRARLDFDDDNYRIVRWTGLHQLWEHVPTGERRWLRPPRHDEFWVLPIAIAFHAAQPEEVRTRREAVFRCAYCGHREVGRFTPFCCDTRMHHIEVTDG